MRENAWLGDGWVRVELAAVYAPKLRLRLGSGGSLSGVEGRAWR